MKSRLLFVGDGQAFPDGLQRGLQAYEALWQMDFAGSADEGLQRVRQMPYDVIIADASGPKTPGSDLVERMQREPVLRNIPFLAMTAPDDSDAKRRARAAGAADLLRKPIDADELVTRLQSITRAKKQQDSLRELSNELDRYVRQMRQMEYSQVNLLWRIAKAGEYRDEGTRNHVVRVGCYCRAIALAMGMPADFVRLVFLTSPLHDVGNFGIPDTILMKPGILTHEEREIVQRHCYLGSELLLRGPVGIPLRLHESLGYQPSDVAEGNSMLTMAASIALNHHERWDGKGYPRGLTGDEIPVEAQITAVADVYDALCSNRPYKRAMNESEALALMRGDIGQHFAPQVFGAFELALDEMRSIRLELPNREDNRELLAA